MVSNRSLLLPIVLFVLLTYQSAIIYVTGLNFFNLSDDLILVLACAFYVAQGASKFPKFFAGIFVFVALTIVSAAANFVPIDVTFVQLRSYLLYVGLLFLLWNMNFDAEVAKRTLKYFTIAFIPALAIGLAEVAFQQNLIFTSGVEASGGGFQTQHFRAISVVGNSIDFANLAGVMLIITIHLRILSHNLKWNTFMIGALCLVILGAGSRGPLIAAAISILLTLPLKRKLIAIIVGTIFLLYAGETIISRSVLDFDPETIAVNYRIIWILQFLNVFVDNPIVGVGPGKFGGWVSINYQLSDVYAQYGISTFGISSIDMFWPHLIGEVGILGLIAFLLPWITTYRFFKKNASVLGAYPRVVPLTRIGTSIVIYVFLISIVNSAYEIQSVQFLLFSIVGLCSKALVQFNRNKMGISW